MTQADKIQHIVGNAYEGSQPATFSYDDATNTYHFKCGNIWFHGPSVENLFTQIDHLFILLQYEANKRAGLIKSKDTQHATDNT